MAILTACPLLISSNGSSAYEDFAEHFADNLLYRFNRTGFR